MKELPLFFEIEPTYRAAKVRPCSMKTAARLFKELVNAANVPEHWIQLLDGEEMRKINFGLSRKTENVFINNTRIQAAVYGLEDGEITYASGTEPEATFDSNYAGYDAPWNQVRTSAKTHRMSAKYLGQIVPKVSAIPRRHTIRVSDVTYHQVVESPVDQCIRFVLDIFPDLDTFDSPITLRIQSRFGHRTFATAFGGDES